MISSDSRHFSFPVFQLSAAFALWTVFGIMLGFVYLASIRPLAISSNASIKPEITEDIPALFQLNQEIRYYRNQTMRRRVEALAKKLFASKTDHIEVSSSDLNSWAEGQFLSYSQEENSSVNKTFIAINPSTPNFQIAERQLHVNYPITIHFFGQKIKCLVLCSGVFESTGYTPTWKMNTLYVNSAPVPFRTALYHLIKPKVVAAFADNNEMNKVQSAWNIIKKIEIKESVLVIHRK